MGIRRFFPAIGLVALATLVSACASDDPVESIMPSSKSSCDAQTIKGEYLVEHHDGSVQLIKERNLETFKEEILRPKISDVKRVEYNQKFDVQEFQARATTEIDNWGFRNLNVEAIWNLGFRGHGVVVAVVDSGVDVEHRSLVNQIATNSGEAGAQSTNGIDDDANGFVDDYYGFSFYDNSNSLTDNVFHGTHVAGVIAAEHSNTSVIDGEIIGLAPEAKILPVKFLDEDGGTLSGAIAAIEYAALRGAKIINASWGGTGCSEILKEKVLGLGQRGILFVAAAGNSGRNLDRSPEYPAAFAGNLQITVGAITPFLGMAGFSNYSNSLVHMFAPGDDIFSAVPGGGAMALSGTSMAAPFVSGAAALIWSARPNLSLNEVRDLILSSVTTNSTYSNATRGRIDLARAVSRLR